MWPTRARTSVPLHGRFTHLGTAVLQWSSHQVVTQHITSAEVKDGLMSFHKLEMDVALLAPHGQMRSPALGQPPWLASCREAALGD